MGEMVPPLSAESLAVTRQRLPATMPTPMMVPPPRTDSLPSSSCMPRPARVLNLEEGRAAVEQAGHAFTGQQLPALVELGTFVGRAIAHQRFQGADLFQAFRHAVDVGLVRGGLGVEGSSQGRHLVTSQEKTGPLSELLDVNVNQMLTR